MRWCKEMKSSDKIQIRHQPWCISYAGGKTSVKLMSVHYSLQMNKGNDIFACLWEKWPCEAHAIYTTHNLVCVRKHKCNKHTSEHTHQCASTNIVHTQLHLHMDMHTLFTPSHIQVPTHAHPHPHITTHTTAQASSLTLFHKAVGWTSINRL